MAIRINDRAHSKRIAVVAVRIVHKRRRKRVVAPAVFVPPSAKSRRSGVAFVPGEYSVRQSLTVRLDSVVFVSRQYKEWYKERSAVFVFVRV